MGNYQEGMTPSTESISPYILSFLLVSRADSLVGKNGPTLALETSDLEENYLFGYWAVSGNEKN